ncbi:LOW QUALITY PROTEIN: involucrin-like [Chamaea fasciata]|uniref:LOW QUALITY PROTEIN: involucrin-like n=1 Tax=Chamaea fasciata TaxID=190680 RepID=UPI00336A551B
MPQQLCWTEEQYIKALRLWQSAQEEEKRKLQQKLVLPQNRHDQTALSEMPCQTQGELFPAQEQEEQLRQQVEEPQENEQNIKAEPQAELPEAQSDTMAVKRRKTEDMRSTQEEMNLHQQRGDQQTHQQREDQVSERVVATPLLKHPLSCFLQDIKEQLQAGLQETEARIKARQKRLEEEMKIIRDILHALPQALQKQVEVLTSHQAACKGFQRMTGKEEPQDRREAQELSPPEVLQVEHDLKAVEDKSTQWEEVEHWNKELEGEKSPWQEVEWSLWQSSFRKSMKMEHESGQELQ